MLVKVISPIDGTPAYKAGISEGDYITHINKEAIIKNVWINNVLAIQRGSKYPNKYIDKNETQYSESLRILNSLSKIIRKNRFKSYTQFVVIQSYDFKLDKNKTL